MARICGISLLALLLVVASSQASKINEYKQTCGKLLRVPSEDLADYMNGVYTNDHEGFCFLRCMAILHNSYDDTTGLDLAKLWPHFGGGLTEEQFAQKGQTCLEDLEKQEFKCHCYKAYKRMACFGTFTFKQKNSSESNEHQH